MWIIIINLSWIPNMLKPKAEKTNLSLEIKNENSNQSWKQIAVQNILSETEKLQFIIRIKNIEMIEKNQIKPQEQGNLKRKLKRVKNKNKMV